MNHYDEKTEMVRQVVKVWKKTTCDRCDATIPQGGDNGADLTLEYRQGDRYPECDCRKGWDLEDICANCATLLRALLESNGFRTKDWESP